MECCGVEWVEWSGVKRVKLCGKELSGVAWSNVFWRSGVKWSGVI